MNIYIEARGGILVPLDRCYGSQMEEAFVTVRRAYQEKFISKSPEEAGIGPFYIWNPGRNPPTVAHGDATEAKAEANRLAKKHPLEKFIVLKQIGSCWAEQYYPCEAQIVTRWED